ncbi:MAG: MBL fold metallo-hydrolase [Firmicutes bacterium]|nr:MBL fold metallo-hydrolase [Bacillota bacterium]
MKIQVFNQNIAFENTYVLVKKNKAIVIDPGFNGAQILEYLSTSNFELQMVLLTHGHFDHLRDIKLLQKHSKFVIYIHELDKQNLFDESFNYAKSFHSSFTLKPEQEVKYLQDNSKILFEDQEITLLHTPGHTIGSSCYLIDKFLFSGDTLFTDSIGRTDLKTGNQKMMNDSILKLKEKISNQTLIYPGHGQSGKMSEIKKTNFYLSR